MKKHLLLWLLIIPGFLSSQDDSRYLAGAVSTDNGKVVFVKDITTTLSQSDLYNNVYTWAENRFQTAESRIAYSNKEKGEIAIVAEEMLTFSSTALALDQALMSYRLIFEFHDKLCLAKISNIRYTYNVSYQREPEKWSAEEIITDKMALNKGKLNRINGKFRKATIDFADEIFKELDGLLGNTAAQSVHPATQVETGTPVIRIEPATPVVKPVEKDGYMTFEASKVPQAILSMLAESPMRVTAGEEKQPIEENATWKGISQMFGKDVATISLSGESPVYKQIQDTFTVSFLKEPTDGTPWMIVKCRKQGETTEGSQKIMIGEIIQIWIK